MSKLTRPPEPLPTAPPTALRPLWVDVLADRDSVDRQDAWDLVWGMADSVARKTVHTHDTMLDRFEHHARITFTTENGKLKITIAERMPWDEDGP